MVKYPMIIKTLMMKFSLIIKTLIIYRSIIVYDHSTSNFNKNVHYSIFFDHRNFDCLTFSYLSFDRCISHPEQGSPPSPLFCKISIRFLGISSQNTIFWEKTDDFRLDFPKPSSFCNARHFSFRSFSNPSQLCPLPPVL